MSELLNRDAILGADDLQTEDVPVPEWGGAVRVRTFTGEDRDTWEQSLVDIETGERKPQHNFRAHLVALTAIDDAGNRLFTTEDVAALGAKSGIALDRVWEVAMRLNGLTEDAVEELTGN